MRFECFKTIELLVFKNPRVFLDIMFILRYLKDILCEHSWVDVTFITLCTQCFVPIDRSHLTLPIAPNVVGNPSVHRTCLPPQLGRANRSNSFMFSTPAFDEFLNLRILIFYSVVIIFLLIDLLNFFLS